MKNKFLKTLLLLTLLFIVPITVEARQENIGGKGNDSEYQDATGKDSSYSSNPYGIRISIITYNKDTRVVKQLGHSYDFWNTVPGNDYYYFRGQKNRYNAISAPLELASNYKKNAHVSSNINFSSNFYAENASFTTVRDAVANKMDQYENTNYDGFLKLFGTSLDDVTMDCITDDIYVAVEPLVTIFQKQGSKRIAGTGTEIGRYIYQNNLSFIRVIINDGRIPLAVYTPNDMAGIIGVNPNKSGNTIVNGNNGRVGGNLYGYSIGFFQIPGLVDRCDPTTKCTFTLDRNIANNCATSTNGYIKDVDDWSCIYASSYSKDNTVKEQYLAHENRYCKIYCREDLNYNFPSDNMTVQAGKSFTLGGVNSTTSLSPIAISGSSTCRSVGTKTINKTKPINVSRPADDNNPNTHYFEEDYRNASSETDRQKYLKELLNCYSYQKTYRELDPTLIFSYNEGQYKNLGTNYNYVGNLVSSSTLKSWSNYNDVKSNKLGSKDWSISSYVSSNKTFLFDERTANNVISTYGPTKTINGQRYPAAEYVEQTTTKKMNYTLKNGLYHYVNKPSGVSTNTPITNNYYYIDYSNLPVSYARQTRDDYTFKLGFTTSWFGRNQRFYKFLTSNYKVDIEYNTSQGVDFNDMYRKIATNNTALSLIEDNKSGENYLNPAFQNQLQLLGYSIDDFLQSGCARNSGCKKVKDNITEAEYVKCTADIACTSCNSQNNSCCVQNYNKLKACITANYNSSTGNVAFSNTDLNYNCTYSVQNDNVDTTDPDNNSIGIDVVYRTVSLSDPFPDRNAGENWTEYNTHNFITYNRGVLTDRLYIDRSPLYSLTLTPDLTKEIRRYNDNHEYPDYTLECNMNGEKCLSTFMREGSFSSHFTGCGIKGRNSGLKCNTNDAW